MISQYNDTEPPPGPRNLNRIVVQRLRMQGFIILDYLMRFQEAIDQLGRWAGEGKLQNRVEMVEGVAAGELVITAVQLKIRDCAAVTVFPAQEPKA